MSQILLISKDQNCPMDGVGAARKRRKQDCQLATFTYTSVCKTTNGVRGIHLEHTSGHDEVQPKKSINNVSLVLRIPVSVFVQPGKTQAALHS